MEKKCVILAILDLEGNERRRRRRDFMIIKL
jgi:hypothetical protein